MLQYFQDNIFTDIIKISEKIKGYHNKDLSIEDLSKIHDELSITKIGPGRSFLKFMLKAILLLLPINLLIFIIILISLIGITGLYTLMHDIILKLQIKGI